jgi:hypothetical protein
MKLRGCFLGIQLSLAALAIMAQSPSLAIGQTQMVENPNRIKAAFLRNFAHYVNWPSHAFADGRAPWNVCILGPDPFGEVLEATLAERTEQDRPFRIFRADTLDRLPRCQIIYVTYSSAAKRQAVLTELRDKPVLTVGDAPDFLEEGGVIRFQVEERIRMNVNLDQARAVSLNIQTRMLEVASGVLDNGVVRKLR